LTSRQSEIGFASAIETVQVAMTAIGEGALAAPRPRVSVSSEEALAHEGRLAALRKKAAVCVWDLIGA
jgi:DNA polymerase III subunit epsilon